ncbi:unnamed protein product, partial [Prorocentrum cordatum]
QVAAPSRRGARPAAAAAREAEGALGIEARGAGGGRNPGAAASSDSEPGAAHEAAASAAGGPEAGGGGGGGGNDWEGSSFGRQGDKDKFLRLMGAKKDGQAPAAGARPGAGGASQSAAEVRRQQWELERQFSREMQRSMHGRGRGLGAG